MAEQYYNHIAVESIMDKDRALRDFVRLILNKTNNMFEYEGLPETLPARFLELYLQKNGNCCVTDYKDNLYCYRGGLGGVPDEYYQPTIYTIANPYQKFNKMVKLGEEGILCRNDMLMVGIMPTIMKYGSLIIENLISFRVASINTRIQTVIDATDDSAAQSAKQYLKDVEEGKLGIITTDKLFENVNITPGGNQYRHITELIEMNQYILSQMYAEMGIMDNYNMKRERLTSGEVDAENNKVVVSIENMYQERCIFCDAINKMFGTNIKVRLNERWGMDADSEGSDSRVQDSGSNEQDSE